MWFLPVLFAVSGATGVLSARAMRSDRWVARLREASEDDRQRMLAPRAGLVRHLVGVAFCAIGVVSGVWTQSPTTWVWLLALALAAWTVPERARTSAVLRERLGVTIGEQQRRRESVSVRVGVTGVVAAVVAQLVVVLAPANAATALLLVVLLVVVAACLAAVAWCSIWVFTTDGPPAA